MPRNTINAFSLFFSVIAIALAAHYADLVQTPDRQPAMERKEPIPAFKGPNLKYTRKIHGPVSSRLELIGAVPERVGDVFVLKGIITSSDEVRDLDFKWAVPPGLEVVNGLVAGTISLVKPDFPAEIQITLRNLEAENHQVHLVTSGRNGGFRFAESAQYNTLLEPVLAASKEELLKSTEKSLGAEDVGASTPKSRELKVFH